MKIYTKNDENEYIYDENHNRQFIELIPCPLCKAFLWSDGERELIRNAVELIWTLSDFELDTWHALSGTGSGRDANDAICLGNLLNPLREPFEYSNDDIGLIWHVLQLAAFAGPANLDIKLLNMVYRKIQMLVAHVHNKHRGEGEKVLPLASWFIVSYLEWIDGERLLSFLPGIRGKSESEITEHLKKEWENLERCKKCREILALVQDEGKLNGLCYKCEPQQVIEERADGKPVCSP